jgi:DNA-binding MarR family transcriptional regulator
MNGNDRRNTTTPAAAAARRARSRSARNTERIEKKTSARVRPARRRFDQAEPNFGPLLGYLGYQIRQAQAAIFRDLTAATTDLDLTPGEFGLLAMIDANPGISQIDLAAIHKLDKSTLSLAVTRLAKRGLIRRARSPDDDRANRLFLRKMGVGLLRGMRERIEVQERTMDAALRPGERELLLDALQRISHAFER